MSKIFVKLPTKKLKRIKGFIILKLVLKLMQMEVNLKIKYLILIYFQMMMI